MKIADNSILSELEDCNGYDVAFLTSYNFEIRFFEKYLYSILVQNNIRIINVFVDSKQLNQSIEFESSERLGKDYFVTPILMTGSFHPKVILLLGDEKAKVIISSANIKISGYTYNNEVFNSFEYDSKNQTYANIVYSVISMFRDLYKYASNCDIESKRRLESFKIEQNDRSDITGIFNTQKPILDQVFEIVDEPVKEIHIAVPFYDKKLEGLRELMSRSNCKNAILYLQNKTNTFPIEYNNEHSIVSEPNIKLFKTVKSNKDSAGFYHGKVMELITDEHSYIMYGSANCTSSALLRTYKQNGNIECGVLVRGDKDENNQFFEDFAIIQGEPIINGFVEEPSKEKQDFSFFYGEVEEGVVRLHLTYENEVSVKAELIGEPVSSYYSNNLLIIDVPIEKTGNSIFDLSLKYSGKERVVRCWFNDTSMLNKNRFSLKDLGVGDYDRHSSFGAYQEYMDLLLYEADKYKDWFIVAKGSGPISKKEKNPDDADEEEFGEEFIIYSDGDVSYIDKERSYTIYRNLKAFSTRWFSSLTKCTTSKRFIKDNDKLDYIPRKTVRRSPTATEKRLARVYKRYIKAILQKLPSDTISYEQAKMLVGTIFDLIKMVKDNEKIDGLFDDKYVTEVQSNSVNILLQKASKLKDKNVDDELVQAALITILNREKYYGFGETDQFSKQMLYDLNRYVYLRNDLELWVSSLDLEDIDLKGEQYEKETIAIQYLDRLFGYKTFEQLKNYFISLYGEETQLCIENNTIVMETKTEKAKLPLKGLPNRYLTEINNYLVNYDVSVSHIHLIFYEYNTSNHVDFEMKTDKKRVAQMTRKYYLDEKCLIHPCFITNQSWQIDPLANYRKQKK